ncbi:MAG TPA: AI-2E family transporter [Anaerolineales bacterium]|nr:AI-2E family transporter [Anaerolineales bacterium]
MKDVELQQRYHQSTPPNPPGEWDQFTRQAAVVILLLGVLFLLTVLRPLLNLLGITGIVILILSYPINKLRAKTKISYSVAVFVVFIPLAILLFLLLSNVTGWFVDNVQALVSTLNAQFDLNRESVLALERALGGTFNFTLLLGNLLGFIGNQLGMAVTFISFTSISVFLAFLFILEMPANIARSFQRLSDVSQREFGILFDRLSNVWNGWLRSTVISSIIIGTTTALELYLFGIPYAGVLGVITGFLNLIPTFGPLISYVLIILVTYTQGSSTLTLSPLALTVLVWGVNVLINQVVRLVIFPRLAGKAVHLPVFFVILGLVVAAVLWGVVGVILVIPLLGTVREVLHYVLRKINRQDPYPGEQPQAGFWSNEISSQ